MSGSLSTGYGKGGGTKLSQSQKDDQQMDSNAGSSIDHELVM